MLRVSDIHEIYVEQSGNPNGKPVIYLHGVNASLILLHSGKAKLGIIEKYTPKNSKHG